MINTPFVRLSHPDGEEIIFQVGLKRCTENQSTILFPVRPIHLGTEDLRALCCVTIHQLGRACIATYSNLALIFDSLDTKSGYECSPYNGSLKPIEVFPPTGADFEGEEFDSHSFTLIPAGIYTQAQKEVITPHSFPNGIDHVVNRGGSILVGFRRDRNTTYELCKK